jgi:hypothetical protein
MFAALFVKRDESVQGLSLVSIPCRSDRLNTAFSYESPRILLKIRLCRHPLKLLDKFIELFPQEFL